MNKDRHFDFSKITQQLADIEKSPTTSLGPLLEAYKKHDEKQAIIQQELEKYKKESLLDALTGCYNQNYFEKYKNENFDPNRDDNQIALVLCDLNNLKKNK